jgi:serine/threonine-protein kinase SIK3
MALNESQEPLNAVVVEHMLRLPGLSSELVVLSVKQKRFDHISAIYNLLVDKLERQPQPPRLLLPQPQRKASITTGS